MCLRSVVRRTSRDVCCVDAVVAGGEQGGCTKGPGAQSRHLVQSVGIARLNGDVEPLSHGTYLYPTASHRILRLLKFKKGMMETMRRRIVNLTLTSKMKSTAK